MSPKSWQNLNTKDNPVYFPVTVMNSSCYCFSLCTTLYFSNGLNLVLQLFQYMNKYLLTWVETLLLKVGETIAVTYMSIFVLSTDREVSLWHLSSFKATNLENSGKLNVTFLVKFITTCKCVIESFTHPVKWCGNPNPLFHPLFRHFDEIV